MPNRQDNKPVLHTRKHIARLERERTQTRIILISFIAILIVSIGAVAYGYLDQNYFQYQRPVASVNGVNITVREWQARVRWQRTQLISQLHVFWHGSQLSDSADPGAVERSHHAGPGRHRSNDQ
jgi:cell division septal protein FtsQ